MKTNKEKNVYVHPKCEVIQVKTESIIATSEGTASQNEEYLEGDTSSWF